MKSLKLLKCFLVPNADCLIVVSVFVISIFKNHQCARGRLKGKVGSIETEEEALQACVDLHAAGPSKVLVG